MYKCIQECEFTVGFSVIFALNRPKALSCTVSFYRLPFQVLGKGKEKRFLKNAQLLLNDVNFENNGWPDTTRFGGAMLICIGKNIYHRDDKAIALHQVSFRNCSAKFGAAIFAATYEQETAPSGAYGQGAIYHRAGRLLR